MNRFVLVGLLALFAGTTALGQGLGDAAEKEKERRAKERAKGTAKAYTNADLEKNGQGSNPPSSSANAAPTPASSNNQTPSADLEKMWRQRAAGIAEEIKAAQDHKTAAEARLRDVGDISNTAEDALDPQRYFKRKSAQKEAEDDLEKAKAEVQTAERDRQSFEEEARTSNIPPGWIR